MKTTSKKHNDAISTKIDRWRAIFYPYLRFILSISAASRRCVLALDLVIKRQCEFVIRAMGNLLNGCDKVITLYRVDNRWYYVVWFSTVSFI